MYTGSNELPVQVNGVYMEKFAAALNEIIPRFAIYGDFEGVRPFGSGHINNTFQSSWNQAGMEGG